MQIGIFAKTFAVSGATPVLQAVRSAGFETTQFNMACVGLASMPDDIPETITQSIADASRASGVKIAALSGTYNMVHPNPKVRADGLKRLSIIIAAAAAMGTPLVTLCTGSRDPDDQWRHHADNATPEAWRDLLREMEQAVDVAERHSIDLGIEPELANVISSASKARLLIDEMPSPCLRVVLDPANLFEVETEARRREIVASAVELLGDRIAMAHAKDRNARGDFAAAGRGIIDFRHFAGCLKDAGFDGPMVAHGLSETEAPDVARFLADVTAV